MFRIYTYLGKVCTWYIPGIYHDLNISGFQMNASDLYSPVLKAPEARLFAAIAAEYGCHLVKTDKTSIYVLKYGTRQGIYSTA